MIPNTPIDSITLSAMLFYLAVLGALLAVGVFLRMKISLFKKFFIPASLLAGFIGLILGPDGAKLLTSEMVSSWGSLAGILITFVFAPMLIGIKMKDSKGAKKHFAPQLFYHYMGNMIQYFLPVFITITILVPLFGVNELFATLIEVGWSGGHGTAAGMGEVYSSFQWEEGGTLGLTSATIGLVVSFIGGIIIINYSVKKGYTSVLKNRNQMKQKNEEDISEEKREPGSYTTISGDVVDGFAFHAALLLIAVLLGWFMQKILETFIPGLPLFPMAMIGGGILNLVISKTSYYKLIDVRTFQRIQGISLEFLIVGAVASIKIPVVVEYALPLFVMSVLMLLSMLWFFFYMGPRMFKEDWFENSIVIFGTLTGVAAIGLMLLRTVDPEGKTGAMAAYGLKAPLFSPFLGGGLITSIFPIMLISYGPFWVGGITLMIFLVLFFVAKSTGVYRKKKSPKKNDYSEGVSSTN